MRCETPKAAEIFPGCGQGSGSGGNTMWVRVEGQTRAPPHLLDPWLAGLGQPWRWTAM